MQSRRAVPDANSGAATIVKRQQLHFLMNILSSFISVGVIEIQVIEVHVF